ncbi:MAG: hypothetical protein LLG14_04420 [Nocardiaceae bacterium]|nr:hypothetical protein [Nocardiaceae bacterium]
MTDNSDAQTEKLQPPPPPPGPPSVAEVPAPSKWDRFRNDPVKVLIVAASIGLFGFGALAFTAGYWVGHADRGDRGVIERFEGPGMRGPMPFRHQFVNPPGEPQSPATTTTPSPTTSAPS